MLGSAALGWVTDCGGWGGGAVGLSCLVGSEADW